MKLKIRVDSMSSIVGTVLQIVLFTEKLTLKEFEIYKLDIFLHIFFHILVFEFPIKNK